MSHPTPDLGQRSTLAAELDLLGRNEPLIPARVLAQHSGRWLVAEPPPAREDPGRPDASAAALQPRLVPARGRLRGDAGGPPVTGDWVALDEAGAITAILPRRGAIVRRAAGEATTAQTLAANVDLVLLTEPAGAVNPRRAERLFALAAAGGIPAIVVLTKADLRDDAHLEATRLARALGAADGFAVSATTGDGLGPLRAQLVPGATSVLLGASGAGKSTLANALLGEARMATGVVRAHDGRGRHTTVTRELIPLPGGALLLDTPGIREVGLWDGGAAGAFSDIEALAADCRFADCAHDGEPGCAVGPGIDPERLRAWRKLAREQAWVDDRRAASRAREASMAGYVQLQRAARHAKGNRGRRG